MVVALVEPESRLEGLFISYFFARYAGIIRPAAPSFPCHKGTRHGLRFSLLYE